MTTRPQATNSPRPHKNPPQRQLGGGTASTLPRLPARVEEENTKTADRQHTGKDDLREQLFNEGQKGIFTQVSTKVEFVTEVTAVLLDIDPALYAHSPLIPITDAAAEELYRKHVKRWIGRDSTLAKAEVRISGRGLHVLLRPMSPIVLSDDRDRERWGARIAAIQASLPIDPRQPGMNALTRPLGSKNSKNGATVRRLKKSEPISLEELEGLATRMINEPFSRLIHILTGGSKVAPCPFCRKPNSNFVAFAKSGRCYECGNVSLEKLMGLIYSRSASQPEVRNG